MLKITTDYEKNNNNLSQKYNTKKTECLELKMKVEKLEKQIEFLKKDLESDGSCNGKVSYTTS